MPKKEKSLNSSKQYFLDLTDFTFLGLEEIAKDFYKKNNLPAPTIERTEKGLIMLFDEGYALLDVDYKTKGSLMTDPSDRRYIEKRAVYTLEGRLKGEKIKLETEITKTTDLGKAEKISSDKHGEPTISVLRRDDKKYWFIIDSRKHLVL